MQQITKKNIKQTSSSIDTESSKNFVEKSEIHVTKDDFSIKDNEKSDKKLFSKNNMDLNTSKKQSLLNKNFEDNFPNIPDSLVNMPTGALVFGDCGRLPDDIPEWLDRKKFASGQRFAMDNFSGISFANALSLFILSSFEDLIPPLIMTGNSSEPYTSFKKFLSSTKRIRNWYSSDIWTKGTPAYKDIQTVRKLHTIIRKKLETLSPDELDAAAKKNLNFTSTHEMMIADFRETCPAPNVGQCPYGMKNLAGTKFAVMNQFDMAVTQWDFVGFVVLHPQLFGIYNATDENLEAFCHVWRGIGYCLGVDDEYNFCRGNLEEIKKRSKDIVEYWAKPNLRIITPGWENLTRCFVEGVGYYIPGLSYESFLLYIGEVMNLHMPRVEASISFFSWLKHHIMKGFLYCSSKNFWIRNILNKIFEHCVNGALNFSKEKHEQLRKMSDKSLQAALSKSKTN